MCSMVSAFESSFVTSTANIDSFPIKNFFVQCDKFYCHGSEDLFARPYQSFL